MRVGHVVVLCGLTMPLSLGLIVGGARASHAVLMAMPVTEVDAVAQAAQPAGLACIQNALGGTKAFAAVSSLRIISNTKPSASEGFRPLPGTREISMVFPDRYKRVDLGQFPNGSSVGSTIGFDRGELLSAPRTPDAKLMMRIAREDFVRQMLMRLPRGLPDVSLSQRVMEDGGRQRLAIEFSGPDVVQATLLADRETCIPVALQYQANSRSSAVTERVELSAYREFGSVRFPTVLKTLQNGIPYSEESVTTVELNARGAEQYFGR